MSSTSAKRALELSFQEQSAKKSKTVTNNSSQSTAASLIKTEPLKTEETNQLFQPDQPMLSPSKIEKPATNVDLHAMVTSISPMKKKHFVGEFVNEKQICGFQPCSEEST
jgi:hypothetical protein